MSEAITGTGAFASTDDLGALLPAAGSVALIAFRLDPSPSVTAGLRRVLDSDERARADRFKFDRHRRRFIVGRGVLRHVLARLLGRTPASVAFAYGEHGKPSVAGSDVPFNLSNSSDLATIAIGGSSELGVDVERLRSMDDAEAIASRFFSTPEVDAFRSLETEDRDHGFFRCWTRKEAYIKAIGDGLTMPLDRFQVAFGSGEAPRFLAIGDDPEEADAWQLLHFEPAPDYLGALALRGPAPRIRSRFFDPTRLAEPSESP